MSVARSILEARVQGILIDDNADAVARIVPEIQSAQKDLEERPYKFLKQDAYINPRPSCGAGVPILAILPEDWIEPHGQPFAMVGPFPLTDQSGALPPPLTWEEFSEEIIKVDSHSWLNQNTALRGPPKSLVIIPTDPFTFWISPSPDGIYEFHIPYYRHLDELTESDDYNWWTENMQDHLVFRAAARVLGFNRDHGEGLRYEIMAEAAYKTGKRSDKRKRYRTHGNRIRPRRDVGGAYTQRRM